MRMALQVGLWGVVGVILGMMGMSVSPLVYPLSVKHCNTTLIGKNVDFSSRDAIYCVPTDTILSLNQLKMSSSKPIEQARACLEVPMVDPTQFCLELVIEDLKAIPSALGFTALATAPNGTLYATRPLTGEVFALTDTNQDGLPESMQVILSGLTLPNALVYHDETLYIAGGARITRWRVNGETQTVVDDLPGGSGFWTGGLAIGDDERLYIGIGAACDACPAENGRSMIVSYALDGTDQREVAYGLRQPNGMIWHDGGLWVTDTARDGIELGAFDEVNRVVVDDVSQDYGFPYCLGINNRPDALYPEVECADYIPPVVVLPTHSSPLALAMYQGEAFPDLQGALLVVLSGGYNESRVRGHEVIALRANPNGELIADSETSIFPMALASVQHYEGFGVYPHRLYGIAISPEGWIYISVGGSRIYALRPI